MSYGRNQKQSNDEIIQKLTIEEKCIPKRGIEPRPPRWEHGIQTTRRLWVMVETKNNQMMKLSKN